MKEQADQGVVRHLLLTYPGIMLAVFFLGPFGIMFLISFFEAETASFVPTFVLSNYARLLSPVFIHVLLFSIYLGALVAVICVAIGFPFTYLLSGLRLRAQTRWLVFLLSVLSLSEVIIAFSWSMLLSRSAGVSNLFVWLGLMDQPASYTPGLAAEIFGYCYLTLPYTVIMFYPRVSQLDPEMAEAAQTMGASPLRAFFTVIVPAMRQPIIASLIFVFVFTLGVYLIPQILARPSQWTLSVLITDQAVQQSNMPFAAALSVFLFFVSILLIAATYMLGLRNRGQPAAVEVAEAEPMTGDAA